MVCPPFVSGLLAHHFFVGCVGSVVLIFIILLAWTIFFCLFSSASNVQAVQFLGYPDPSPKSSPHISHISPLIIMSDCSPILFLLVRCYKSFCLLTSIT